MIEVSALAALLGGVLSLLSPCSALLLPAFFAYAFRSPERLVARTLVFYAGLCATLVPLGMGISFVGSLVYGHRAALILVSGVVLILFGVLQVLGRGFAVGSVQRLEGTIRGEGVLSTFALGAVYGFAGFCSGPILGAVLTVAAGSGSPLRGAALLSLYAAGMAVPLLLMALLWERLDLGRRRLLRGREVAIGPLRLHSTNLISGLLFIGVGVAFILYQGTSALEGVYAANGLTDLALAAEGWTRGFAESTVGGLLFAALGLLVCAVVLRTYLARRGEARREKGR